MDQNLRLDITPVKGPVANAFVLLINALFFNVRFVGNSDQYPEDSSNLLQNGTIKSFDFIIVGGGAAGCALANKLSQVERWSILVLEAGGYPSSTSEVPGFYSTLPFTEEDWAFRLEKEPKSCLGKKCRTCTLTRGKVLGGSSSINNMIYVRGIPEHVNQWNFPEWNGTVVHEILHSLEGLKDTIHTDSDIGSDGEIHLDIFEYKDHLKNVLIDSYREAGIEDSEKRKYIRLTHNLVYSENGERFNMAEAFLTPIKDKQNLYLSIYSEVLKLNMADKNDSRIQSVNVNIRGKTVKIKAKKEIILTAGAINNAKLLLLSGIGPKQHLEKRKVPVVKDLQGVGRNLQMHLNVPLFVGVTRCKKIEGLNETECYPDVYNEHNFLRDIFNYIMSRKGNLSNIELNDMMVYMYTKKRGGIYPNIGIYHNYFKINDKNMENLFRNFQFNPAISRSLGHLNKERSVVMFSLSLLRPESSGQVFLNDKNIYDNPKIKAHFLTAGEDLDTLVTAYGLVKEMIDTCEINTQNASVLHLDIPNCRHMDKNSAKYARCYVTNMAYPITDAAGTTKMGFPCDGTMVVDKVLEVRGIRCLRVGDSSILPNITIASSVATDVMLGFRLSEILKAKWLKNYSSSYTIETNQGI